MDDKGKRFVDELLDASLRRYASVEPRPGLEGRVLACVRARQQASRRRSIWAWGMGLAAVATMVALVLIYWPRQQPVPLPVTAKAPANVSAPVVAKAAPTVQLTVSHRPPRQTPPNRVDWRPQQFPTPRPLSEQEKLLVAYAQSLKGTPAVLAQQENDIEHDLEIPPLSIAAIKIEPLAPLGSEAEK
jgi:hypothetical protein